MGRGKVKWFDQQMGYGYIINEKGEDVLAYAGDIQSQDINSKGDVVLTVGLDVEFETVSDQGERIAVNIVVSDQLDMAPAQDALASSV